MKWHFLVAFDSGLLRQHSIGLGLSHSHLTTTNLPLQVKNKLTQFKLTQVFSESYQLESSKYKKFHKNT